MPIAQSPAFSGELAQARIGIRHRPNQARRPIYDGRQRIGTERLVTVPRPSPNTGGLLRRLSSAGHDRNNAVRYFSFKHFTEIIAFIISIHGPVSAKGRDRQNRDPNTIQKFSPRKVRT